MHIKRILNSSAYLKDIHKDLLFIEQISCYRRPEDIMVKHITDHVTINDSYISINELNEIDTDLWRKAIKTFGAPSFKTELYFI